MNARRVFLLSAIGFAVVSFFTSNKAQAQNYGPWQSIASVQNVQCRIGAGDNTDQGQYVWIQFRNIGSQTVSFDWRIVHQLSAERNCNDRVELAPGATSLESWNIVNFQIYGNDRRLSLVTKRIKYQ